jgi:hypothetical protein
MASSIEEQFKAILQRAPAIGEYLNRSRARIAVLEAQLAAAKTTPKRKAIKRELNNHLRYVSQASYGNRQKRPSAHQLKKQKATEKKLRWLAGKADKNRS